MDEVKENEIITTKGNKQNEVDEKNKGLLKEQEQENNENNNFYSPEKESNEAKEIKMKELQSHELNKNKTKENNYFFEDKEEITQNPEITSESSVYSKSKSNDNITNINKDNYIIYSQPLDSQIDNYTNKEQINTNNNLKNNENPEPLSTKIDLQSNQISLVDENTKQGNEQNTNNNVISNSGAKDYSNCSKYSYLERTDLITEKQRLKIYNVIKAFSVYDKSIGYTQGINFISAMLLLHTNSERAAFWILIDIMENKNWRELFTKNTPKLLRVLELFTNKLMKNNPVLYKHFLQIEFAECIYGIFSNFFLTIFTYSIYIEFSARIMDMFFILEEKIIIDTLLHLLKLKENELLKMDMEETAMYIRTKFVNECIEEYGINMCLPY